MTFAFTREQLVTICPDPDGRADEFLSENNAAMAEADVSTPLRAAAWIAQWAHETAEFQIWREIWGPTSQQLKYERPLLADGTLAPKVTEPPIPLWQQLGNTEPGDRKRFRGRGVPQLTGRNNYKAAGKAQGLDLVQVPDLLCGPILKPPGSAWPGFQVAAWFWRTHGCNALADAGDFVGLTKRINGGTNGLAQRQAYWATAKQVLGLEG